MPFQQKRKTFRKIRSTRLGSVELIIESAPDATGSRVVPSELQKLVPKGKSFCYDTIWDVTRMHFLECKQRVEIQQLLPFSISTGAVSNLYKEGLAYVRACHESANGKLKEYYQEADKPFIILMDGTNEGGAHTHFQVREAYSGNMLLARRIATENQSDIEGVLREVQRDFGRPDAVIADMASSGIAAVSNLWEDKVPLFVCQFHFLRDLGNDMLGKQHQNLRKAFASCRLTEKLNQLRARFLKPGRGICDEDYMQAILELIHKFIDERLWISY